MDVTHEVNTREKAKADERRKQMEEERKGAKRRGKEEKLALVTYNEETEALNKMNDAELQKVTRGLCMCM